MDAAQLATIIIGSGGGGAILVSLIRALSMWMSGSAGRERGRNTSLEQQRVKAIQERDRAIRERDAEATKRRVIQEAASGYRRQLIEAGITPGAWPDIDENTTPRRFRAPAPKEKP